MPPPPDFIYMPKQFVTIPSGANRFALFRSKPRRRARFFCSIQYTKEEWYNQTTVSMNIILIRNDYTLFPNYKTIRWENSLFETRYRSLLIITT